MMLWLLGKHKTVFQVPKTALTTSSQNWLDEGLPNDGDFKDSPTMSTPKVSPFSGLMI